MYQRTEFGHGGGGALALDRRQPVTIALDADRLIRRIGQRVADLDLVVDLGARIGSRDWFRGLATCAALCWAAISTAPGFSPIDARPEAPLSQAHWEQARALAFAPLAYGADTGRRMAPTEAVEPLADTPERPSVELTATIGQGDGFARGLERAGVAEAQARQVAQMVAGAIPLDDLRPGTRIDITLGRRASRTEARPLDHLRFRAAFDLSLAMERVAGRLQLKRIPIAVDNTPLRIEGVAGSSLYRSARAAGAPAKAVETYLRTLSQRLAIGSIGADDRFDLIIEHRRAATGEVEVGGLLLAGLDQGRRKTQLLKWDSDGRSQWFASSGIGETRGGMARPVAGRMTSSFGMRVHPLLGYSRFHKGVDYGAPYGAPIVAATDGVIVYSGWHGGHGNFVRIAHAGGLGTGYGHMSRIVARVGQRVVQGQVIGYVGSTGLSTGPHLHYEVYRNSVAINPASVSFATTLQLAGDDLARFKARLGQLLAVKPGAARPAAVRRAEAKPADKAKAAG